nr:serine hydrolase [Membranihabitans maritimus]
MDSVAFLVAKDGLLIFEKYWNGHQVGTLSNSFSMAKSVVVMLLGCAIKDGFIESLQTNVSDYFPVYSKGKGSRLTVGDLARMSTGMDWQEEYYLPFNVTTQAYYGDQLNKLILGRKIKEDPGKSFTYLSGNTQLLAMVLSEVLPCTLSEYLTKKIWSPLGMESDAKWMIDESVGMERAYCCINATARDFLRLGQLLLQKGQWDNKIILDEEYVDLMTRPAFLESPQYGYGLWLDLHYEYPFYMMRGHLGQYVIVIPSMDLVITRLGKKNAKREVEGKQIPEDVYSYIEGVMSAVS